MAFKALKDCKGKIGSYATVMDLFLQMTMTKIGNCANQMLSIHFLNTNMKLFASENLWKVIYIYIMKLFAYKLRAICRHCT